MLPRSRPALFFFYILLFSIQPAIAYESGARIRATGGVHQVEGSSGSGIVPWAVISGYGQRGEWGINAFVTSLSLDDFDFSVIGASIGINDRLELSVAQQSLDISELNLPLDELEQTVVGVKVRLLNNLIYDRWPQISVGLQFKETDDFTIPNAVGAEDDQGTDFYMSASKLWLSGVGGYPFLLTTTARLTDSNQLGLLGFGGDRNDDKEWMAEVSAAFLLSRGVAVGAEYRQKPDNLGFAKEEDWRDVYVAWFPTKSLSLTFAYAELGNIAFLDNQSGFYISLQGTL